MSCHTLPCWSVKAELSVDRRNEVNASRVRLREERSNGCGGFELADVASTVGWVYDAVASFDATEAPDASSGCGSAPPFCDESLTDSE